MKMFRQVCGLLLVGAGSLFSQQSTNAPSEAFQGTQFKTNKIGVVDALMTQQLLTEKPPVFSNLAHRLDYIQENLTYDLQSRVYALDSMFTPHVHADENVPRSRFRLGVFLELEEARDFEARFSPDFKADVELPNMEKQWRIFITTTRDNDLPGQQVGEEDTDTQLGISRLWKKMNIRTGAGIKLRVPPDVFVKATWAKDFPVGDWVFVPYEKLFWEADEGFGSLSTFQFERWFEMFEHDWVFRSTSAGLITEETQGWQLEQTVSLTRFDEWIHHRESRKFARRHAAAKASGLFFSTFGHLDELDIVDKHRVGYFYRWPIYKRWLFAEISPQLEWENQNSWETETILRFGFDALFWGAETY